MFFYREKLRFVLVFFVLLCISLLCLSFVREITAPETAEALFYIHVLDENGNPVPGASLKSYFNDGKSERNRCHEQITDQNGFGEARGKCWLFDAGIYIEKEGYYPTEGDLGFRSEEFPKGGIKKDGKWHPYGKVVEFILKRRKNPVTMVMFYGLGFYPTEKNVPYGYDLEYGDFVEPFGDGKTADFFLTVLLEDTAQTRTRIIRLSFPGEKDACYVAPLYKRSRFPSPYCFEEKEGIQKTIDFVFVSRWEEGREGRFLKYSPLKNNQCLVMRTRTRCNEKGELISAHYSKIYGPIPPIREHYVNLDQARVFFNPRENENNLECNGKWDDKLRKGKRHLDSVGF